MDRVLAEFTEVTEVSQPTIGGKASAVAWRAREPETGRWVLIKKLPGSYAKARTTHSLGLRHPLIASPHRWLADSGSFYVVRDWIDGDNLRGRLDGSAPRAFDRLRTVLDPVLDALEYAHQAGQAHGAVVPENVVITPDGRSVLTDFGMTIDRNGARARYRAPSTVNATGHPTVRSDYYSLCEVYKEFLPDRPPDDEAGVAARNRILRNLSDVQVSSASADEFRYKLDAVTRIAEILGFCSTSPPAEETRRIGPKLVCQVNPPTAVVATGSGAAVSMIIWNEGDRPLRIDSVGSDAVWLNYHTRFSPITLGPDGEAELPFTLSAARLQPGTYKSNLIIRSNHGMATLEPPEGMPWHEHVVGLPVLVNGPMEPAAPQAPLAERMAPPKTAPIVGTPPDSGWVAVASEDDNPLDTPMLRPAPPSTKPPDTPGIACIQDPDPAVVRYGQKGVLHLGVKNIGQQRLRIDRVNARPSWLTYPGEFQAIWIEPGATQYLGFSVAAATLTAGDYRAEVTFMTSIQEETELGQRNIWREMKCDVRVRVVRQAQAGGPVPQGAAGCATLIAGALTALAALAALIH